MRRHGAWFARTAPNCYPAGVLKNRAIFAALVAFWLAFGPAASAWAQSIDGPCESMSMSMAADDCCGDDTDQAKCLSACLPVSPAAAVAALRLDPSLAVAAAVPNSSFRHASVLAPPDAAPPKADVS
jgi:hypothetical protein